MLGINRPGFVICTPKVSLVIGGYLGFGLTSSRGLVHPVRFLDLFLVFLASFTTLLLVVGRFILSGALPFLEFLNLGLEGNNALLFLTFFVPLSLLNKG